MLTRCIPAIQLALTTGKCQPIGVRANLSSRPNVATQTQTLISHLKKIEQTAADPRGAYHRNKKQVAFIASCLGIGVYCYYRYEKKMEMQGQREIITFLSKSTYPEILKVLRVHPEWLGYISNPTDEMILTAVAVNPAMIVHYRSGKSLTFMIEAIRRNSNVVRYLGNAIPSSWYEPIWEEAIRQNVNWFRRVPRQTWNLAVCAIKQDPTMIDWVTDYKMQTKLRTHFRLQAAV